VTGHQYLMNKLLTTTAILLIATSALAQSEALLEVETYTVERVIDGDTLKLTNGEEVQMIGIKAPEDEKVGQEATEFIKWLEGKEIELEFDVQERDKYGRLLAYVYSPIILNMINAVVVKDERCLERDEEASKFFYKYYEGCSAHLNASIIKAGYATPMTIPPNVKYADLFQRLYEEAQKEGRGLWKERELKLGEESEASFDEVIETLWAHPHTDESFMMGAPISSNIALAQSTLRVLSIASETYATANRGRYPLSTKVLVEATPPYINEDYCDRTISGFSYTCEMSESGYTFVATPTSEEYGLTTYTITTGGNFTP